MCLVDICQIQRNNLELLKIAQTCLPRLKPKIQKIQTEIYNIQIYVSNRTNDKYTKKNNLRILKFFWLYNIWENNFQTKYFRIW